MRRTAVFAIVIAIALPIFATEPNPSARQRELIDKLLASIKIDEMTGSVIDSMYAGIQEQFLKDAAARGNDPDDIAEAKELFEAFRARSRAVNFGALLHEAFVRIYAKYFTEEEIVDISAFYASPIGKKMVELTPRLMADGMKAGTDNLEPKMREVMAEVMEEQAHKRPWRRTMSDMRTIATAVEAYQTDQNDETYPAASDMAGLKTALKGINPSLPEKDMWGNAYEYVVSEDRHHYRIVSAGADGIFEWDSRRIDAPKAGQAPSVRYRDHLEDDLIYADGMFVQLPIQAKPKTKHAE